jgi:hypothetical protein
MFQFTGFASTRLWIQRRNIREPRDQRSFVSSPGLIADFHALHRLLMPRHPPCALNSLTTNIHCSWTPASPLQVALFSIWTARPGSAPDRDGPIHPKMPSTHEQPNCQRSSKALASPSRLGSCPLPVARKPYNLSVASVAVNRFPGNF